VRAFKWFRKVDNLLVSDNQNVGAAKVVYHKGIANHPVLKGTKLFVFKTLDNAYNYSAGRINKELWEVDIPDDSKPMQYRARLESTNADPNRVSNFWNPKKKILTMKTRTPRGTYGAEWVWPIRRIQF
jgi:hypothetical protein